MAADFAYEYVFLFTIVLLGTTLNSLVIVTLLVMMISKGDKKLRNIVLISLAVSDCLPALFGFTLEITSVDNPIVCKCSAFVVTSSSMSSIMHMVLLMVERAYSIKYPYQAQIVLKKRSVIAGFVGLPWVYGITLGLCPLLGWGNYTHEGVSLKRCSIDINTGAWRKTTYNYSLLLIGYVVPIIITVTCFLIIKKEYTRLSEKAARYQGKHSYMTQRSLDEQRSFTIMFLVMLLVFLICWTPYASCIVYKLCHGFVSPFVLDVSAYFGKCSTIFNPIIYTLIYKSFNKALRRVLCFSPCREMKQKKQRTFGHDATMTTQIIP